MSSYYCLLPILAYSFSFSSTMFLVKSLLNHYKIDGFTPSKKILKQCFFINVWSGNICILGVIISCL